MAIWLNTSVLGLYLLHNLCYDVIILYILSLVGDFVTAIITFNFISFYFARRLA